MLQQSALSTNDASCSPAKQSALVDAVLAVHDRAQALVHEGRPATLVEAADFGPLVRAGPELGPGDAVGVAERLEQVLANLEVSP